ncbi:MAG: DNA-binding protein [Methylocystis sp.]|jgi:predicted DNA-binding transcriptional regulator AlpA
MSSTENPKLIPDPQVARDLGRGLRTLDRWDRNPELNFPKPIKINKRKYRDADEVAAWLRERALASIGPSTKEG